MKKKTIVFSCLAVLFLLSAFSGFVDGLVSGGIGCLVICVVFAFLAFRSAKPVAETSSETPQTPNRFIPPTNKSSFSQPLQDNMANTNTAGTPAAVLVPSTPAPPVQKETTVIQPATVSDVPDQKKQFEYLAIKVAGVTFNNDDGESRQTLLSLIRFKRPPFTGSLDISLNQYDFRGSIAYAICVNGYQIGNVPKSQISYVHENFERILEISKINVYGGGHNKSGKDIDFGAEITLTLRNDT